jgi:predicted transcriptional regulator of viral defense system
MKYEKLLELVGQETVFHSGMLVSGHVDTVDLGRQLSRWVKAGKLVQLRRGLYTLPEQYRKAPLHPFVVANRLKRASYVSLQSALEHYGLIPEYVPSVTSVTTGRPGTYATPVGCFLYRHIKTDLFLDYSFVDVGGGQSAFIARPEKALLDLLYLTAGSDDPGYLRELRLQNIANIDMDVLSELAGESGSRKLVGAVAGIRNLHENGSGS